MISSSDILEVSNYIQANYNGIIFNYYKDEFVKGIYSVEKYQCDGLILF